MIDIVTVVFREELPILKVQAQSIDLYCQNIGLQTIYVMVNDDDSLINEIDTAWWGSLANRVCILPRSVFSVNWAENGWLTQQLLKMLASSISYNTWSMVLDAKTILIQPVDLNLLFDQERLRLGYYDIQPNWVFEPAVKIVNNLFNINMDKMIAPAGVPFFFNNNIIRELIAKVARLTNTDFPRWFQEQGMITEFALYTGFILYRDNTLDNVCVQLAQTPYNTPNICHSEVARFDIKFENFLKPTALTTSIHRGAWAVISTEQKERYQNYLLSKGITTAQELV